MAKPTRIAELSAIIAENTAMVDDYLQSHSLPSPSLDVDGPRVSQVPLSEIEIVAAQDKVIASTQELHNLMKGPTETLLGIAIINPIDVMTLQAIYRYNVFSAFPLQEETTFEQLSSKCGLDIIHLKRILRQAMTNHIFHERNGKVVHTAASRVLLENDLVRNEIGLLTEEMFQGASRVTTTYPTAYNGRRDNNSQTVDALIKYDGANAPNQSGFSLAHNTDNGLYDEFQRYPERGRRFAAAMRGFAERHPLDSLASGFDWHAVKTVVDVGGGWGPVSIGLAQRFDHLKFTVQDLEHVVADGPSHVPTALSSRIQFETRNILEQQTRHGADVYLFRFVLHNYPDAYCVKLLRAQIPALKPGAHVIVHDGVIPEPRDLLPPWKEKYRCSMDLIMLTFFGARERTLRDWAEIFRKADTRFKLRYEPEMDDRLLDLVWNEHQ